MLKWLMQHLSLVVLAGAQVCYLGSAIDAQVLDLATLQAGVALQLLLFMVTTNH